MEPNPGQAVFAAHQILVKRLVLMPEDNYADDWHRAKIQSSMACSKARSGEKVWEPPYCPVRI
jgi:hypothetical protein